MLAKVGAAVKGLLQRRLSYEDLHLLIESSLTNPAPLEILTESAHLSWAALTGANPVSFNEHWRSERISPLLQVIAEQPTHRMQACTLRGLLLDEAAIGKWAVMILKLPDDDVAGLLASYPDTSNASRPVEWKREHVALELCFSTMNTAVILTLGNRGFGLTGKQFDPWMDLYGEAFGQQIAQAALLGSELGNPRDSIAGDDVDTLSLFDTIATIAAIREEIIDGNPDVNRNSERYERLVRATKELLELGR